MTIVVNHKLKPVADKILVRPIEVEDVTAGGIILAEISKQKSNRGVIEALGRGVRTDGVLETFEEADELHVGDTIMYAQYGGTEVTYEGVDYVLIHYRDVKAIVNEG